jgi:aminodeoxyfutalosine deaminase
MSTSKSAHYSLLQSMPKVELHVHLEGAIQPATLLELAQRHNRLDMLPGTTEAALRQWFHFTNFPHFIEIYTAISDLLRTPDDFVLITVAYAAEMARQQIRYAEVTFTPYTHTHLLDKSLTIDDIFMGLDQGRALARQQYGVEIVWVFDIARNTSMLPAEITLDYALAGRNHGVIGLGLGGNEVSAPPAYFTHAFDQARSAGLRSLPHAGELAGPESVWGAIYALGAERIGHGVRSIEDPVLLAYLRQHQIPLEVNITSNICLHTYHRVASHPFPHLNRMGILVTLNSDDPPLFNTDLTHEYTLLMDEFGYSLADVARIARNAFVAAATPETLRNQLLLELDTWVKANVTPTLTAPPHEAMPQ